MEFKGKELSGKYLSCIYIICVICAGMVGEILTYRTPWTITGSIGGIIQMIAALSIPIIGMSIGKSFINDERDFKEYYKDIFTRYIIPFGIYYVLLKILSLGQYKVVEITGIILGMFILAPFIKVLLQNLNEKKLKYLIGLIFVGSIINVYFEMFWIDMTIDFSVFSSWLVFCVIGYALPQIRSKKTKKNIYILGLLAAALTFMVRAVPIETQLWSVSPTMILYSSAVFLFLINFKWTTLDRVKVIRKPVNFINNHKVGIFFVHNFIIDNILYDKLNISANRFKVIFGSGIVLISVLVLGGAIAALVDWLMIKYEEKLIKIAKGIVNKLSDIKSYKHYLIWIFAALVITFMAESLLREGMEYALDFVHFVNHKKFIANFLLVLAVTSPCLLFKRHYLVLGLLCEVLVGFSAASAVMYGFRGTPLTYSDFFAIQDGLAIAGEYVSMPMIVAVVVILAILIFINVRLARYKVTRKSKINLFGIGVILVVFLFARVNLNYVLKEGILDPVTWDIKYSYNQNGFYFSLYNSYLGYKREKPELYNAENIEALKENIQVPGNSEFVLGGTGEAEGAEKDLENTTSKSAENPNVIMIQLESIMDPLTFEGVSLTEDPLKNIREISERTTSGKFFVPSYGGGTARSEFEVLTGMSLDYFSSGELPHNTYLKKECIESIAYVLDSEIYDKTLIHNYQGSFYERNKAYEHLGFERYIPMEYMYNRQFWDVEYPEDQLILDNIKATLETTEKSDFIFAIGVQTHGSYKTEYESEDSEIIVTGSLDEMYINQLQDYVDDLVMVDRMVAELVEYIDNLEEPTILAIYSDHLPAYGPIGEQYSQEEQYTTQYFIYDNMGFEKDDRDIEAYELTTRIFDMLGVPGGVMNQFHRNYKADEDYQQKMEYLQYDMLDGKKYIYNKTTPYTRTNMKMGIKEITIDDAIISDGSIEVIGKNFNEFSCIYVDGKPVPTEYVDGNKLVGELSSSKATNIKVHQLTRRNKSIGATKEYVIPK